METFLHSAFEIKVARDVCADQTKRHDLHYICIIQIIIPLNRPLVCFLSEIQSLFSKVCADVVLHTFMHSIKTQGVQALQQKLVSHDWTQTV